MPEMTGFDVLEQVMAIDPGIDVVMMTAHYSTESAVEAIRKGAADYLEKPIKLDVLRGRVDGLLEQARQRRKAASLESELLNVSGFAGLVGNSPAMWDLFAKIRRVAPHFRTVSITGETGTGKDLVARALHQLSPVSTGNFVVLNCSAVVETLFESELFGHVRGAFTGAASDKMGLYEYANNGVLFLDEIGDMPLSTQAKLLRALQNQEVQRVGSLSPRRVNVRVIAATNKDLRAAVAERRFREDLYYRLNMVELRTPKLRDRSGDLPLLIRHFLRHFNEQYGRQIIGLTRRAELVLSRYDWPGNIRELENAIGHACMMATGERIDVSDMPEHLGAGKRELAETASSCYDEQDEGMSSLDLQEKELVSDALTRSHGNQSEAARILKIGRDALRYKMKKYGLDAAQ
jgi:DNA-binding NtrC family response regulator